MEIWERKAAKAINAARSLVRDEQGRLYRDVTQSPGRMHRQGELEEIGDLLAQAKTHVDPHGVVLWEYQTPLPF